MYILLCGEPPFFGNTYKEVMKEIVKGIINFPSKDTFIKYII